MHAATAVLFSGLALYSLLRTANAHANGLTSSICATFNVHHTRNPQEDNSKEVALELLLDNGTVTDCFWPQQDYKVRLSADALIKGFVLQAVTGARLPSPSRRNSIPVDTTWGPCEENTVSHMQVRNRESKDLIFPITTRKSARPLLFRYSVVFSMTSFQQDRYVEIPCCHNIVEPATVNTTAAIQSGSGPVATSSGSGTVPISSGQPTEPPTGIEVEEGHCGKNVTNIVKSFNDTHNGIRYNCTIIKPLRLTTCVESCDMDGSGQLAQCYVHRHIQRKKGYTCVPYRDGDQELLADTYLPFNTTYPETVTKGCKCFLPIEASLSL